MDFVAVGLVVSNNLTTLGIEITGFSGNFSNS